MSRRASGADKLALMYACPCCGYKTLPGRGDYHLCPVCWWEDDGVEPWEYSDPNGQTLVEAQQEFLAEHHPYRQCSARVRPPTRRESRDPDWRPYDLNDDLLARARRTAEEHHRYLEEESRRVVEEIAGDPEGPLKQYNAAMRSLSVEARTMPHREFRRRLRDLGRLHGFRLPEAYLELQARSIKEEGFYRRHPLQAIWWLLRYGRPGTFSRRWQELRTGTFHVAD